MGETVSLFTTTFNRSPEHLSSDAGSVLLREILDTPVWLSTSRRSWTVLSTGRQACG